MLKKFDVLLVGLTQDGGLVVFEAKVTQGRLPLHAIFRAVYHLACLLRARNLERIVSGYQAFRNEFVEPPIPAEIQDVEHRQATKRVACAF